MRNAMILAALAAMPVAAQTSYTDDLTDGLFDAPFLYDLSSDFDGNGPGGDFNDLDTFGLCLCSDEVDITFDIAEPVAFASVNVSHGVGPGGSEITFNGTLGSLTFANLGGGLESYSADLSSGIGTITSINIWSFESFLLDVSIRTVPTPGSLALLGLGTAVALRRRR